MNSEGVRGLLHGCVAVLMCLGLAAASTAPSDGRSARLPPRPALGYAPDGLSAPAAPVSPEVVDTELGSLPSPTPPTPVDRRPQPKIDGQVLHGVATATDKTIRCVAGRQTADPLAPPCIEGFEGDNGGATWRGVTRDEVKVILRVAGGGGEPDPAVIGGRRLPTSLYVDLDAPLAPDAPIGARALQGLTRYFNRRFQTYGRKVHVVLHYDDRFAYRDPDLNRALAAEYDIRVRPFATLLGQYDGGAGDPHHSFELADRGIVVFDTRRQVRRIMASRPNMLWALRPSTEHHATLLSSYLCRKVVPHTVALSGNPGENGRPRRLALVRPAGQGPPEAVLLAQVVRQQVEDCGGVFVEELAFPTEFGVCAWASPNFFIFGSRENDRVVAEKIARLRTSGVTTLVWPSCPESRVARAVSASGWRPEWILSGDGAFDRGTTPAEAGYSELFHRRAVMVTPRPYEPPVRKTLCAQALQEVALEVTDFHELYHGCRRYPLLRQLFTAVQVAGPHLRPDTISLGFERFPAVTSTDPEVPSCGYLAGEYSCIKDAQVQWWDAVPQSETSRLVASFEVPADGCWRSIEQGRRYLPDGWPEGNIDGSITWNEPCSAAFSE